MDAGHAPASTPIERHTGWTPELIGHVAILLLVNVVVDTVITAPLLVLPELLEQFGAGQPAWLNASAMLAGAMWAPLLGRLAALHGRRQILVLSLVLAAAGALICLAAPTLWVFVIGRVVEGAAVASLFLTVGIVRELCAPRLGMVVTGVVTSGNAVIGIVFAFLFATLGEQYGYQVVFITSFVFAVLTAVLVHLRLPKTAPTKTGRVDVAGAVLLGAGLAMVVGYISVGNTNGWLAAAPLALAGLVALAGWYVLARRRADPIIDINGLNRPLVLMLLVVVFGTGAYQSMLQLFSLITQVSPAQGLGYGVAAPAALSILHAVPPIGIVLGGVVSGVLTNRIGAAATLTAGVAIGTIGTLGLFVGVSSLPVAAVCSLLLSLTAGTLVTSGFNLASTLVSLDRDAAVSSLVMTMIAIGSVVFNFVGAAVLDATHVTIAGTSMSSAVGVLTYVGIGTAAFLVAGGMAVLLLKTLRRTVATPTSPVPRTEVRPGGSRNR
ncbi:MFS transporter [Pseudonocardia xinjiangensis]|uniref:MFS transporter n=1 Tax=Pseudonocardia xinjiangensis TaxID=75289 RepID=A0ABX1R7N9_9PSEU|nr:MFS transporter [Pseudonocardia xinjiangensis]NMH76395.1 MFS transporter [Pseudonocardia xinjiangensis]